MGNCSRPGDTLSVHSCRPDVHLGEVALRYFRTFDMFSEHCDDNHELAAMYYFVFPQNKRTVMFFFAWGPDWRSATGNVGTTNSGFPWNFRFPSAWAGVFRWDCMSAGRSRH